MLQKWQYRISWKVCVRLTRTINIVFMGLQALRMDIMDGRVVV